MNNTRKNTDQSIYFSWTNMRNSGESLTDSIVSIVHYMESNQISREEQAAILDNLIIESSLKADVTNRLAKEADSSSIKEIG